MVEPEPQKLAPSALHEPVDGTSNRDNSIEENSVSGYSSASIVIDNLMTDVSEDMPEFELEEEVEESCEFELEDSVTETSTIDHLNSEHVTPDHAEHQTIESEKYSNLLSGEFDAKTLENLLTESEETEKTEEIKEEICKDINEAIISRTQTLSEFSKGDNQATNIAEKDSTGQVLEQGTLTGLQPESKPEDKSEAAILEPATANNSDYSDDILSSSVPASFDHPKVTEIKLPNDNEKQLISDDKTDIQNNTTTAFSSLYPHSDDLETKINLDGDLTEHEHSVGTLHQQQVQNLEMSLLERVDDLIGVLENKHKSGNRPEQLPHKQFATGIHYIKFEKNHYLGGKWLRKAAMQGHAKAQLYLGMLFVQGNGVPKSMFHAYAWFSLAACQDIPEAVDARKKLEPRLTAKEINASLRYAADLLDKIHNF